MRGALWIISLCFVLVGCVTPTVGRPTRPEDKEFQAVIEIPGQTKDQLFARSLAWMAETFVSSKAVIELQDKENGKIIGNASTTVWVPVPLGLQEVPITNRYTLILEAKDGAVRLTAKGFDGFIQGWSRAEYLVDNVASMAKIRTNMETLCHNLRTYLAKSESKW